MSPSLLPEAQHVSVLGRRLAQLCLCVSVLLGVVSVIHLGIPTSFAQTLNSNSNFGSLDSGPAGSGSSDGVACDSNSPPMYYYYMADEGEFSDTACAETEPAFCLDSERQPEMFNAEGGVAAIVSCCGSYKEFTAGISPPGYCPDVCIGLEQAAGICDAICCSESVPGEGRVADEACGDGEYTVFEITYDSFGEPDFYATCGSSSSSVSSGEDSSVPLCGNGELDVDVGEECDEGSWCVIDEEYDSEIYNAQDMESCIDQGGAPELTGDGDGCSDACLMEELYCCTEGNVRQAVSEVIDYYDLLSWTGMHTGEYLTGQLCGELSPSFFPAEESNMTETDMDASCFCGDGYTDLNYDEECDLGQDDAGLSWNEDHYGCTPNCEATCGDGYTDENAYVVDAEGNYWAWDTAFDDNGDAYTYWLTEQCDDGNSINSDGCDNYCQMQPIYYCQRSPSGGSAYRAEVPSDLRPEVDVGYECGQDDPYLGSECFGTVTGGRYDSCECGDGIVQSNEDCDLGFGSDGGTRNITEYGCSPSCQYVCGDNTVQDGAYVVNGDGDDWVYDNDGGMVTEQCDDGNFNVNDGCDENCQEEPGLCCFYPADWEQYGYFEYEEDTYTGEKVDQAYCDYYDGLYYDPLTVNLLAEGGATFYDTCQVPGICCPNNGSDPYETLDGSECLPGNFLDPAMLAAGDMNGEAYDVDANGSYDAEELSYACYETGVCCIDLDGDAAFDMYEISNDQSDVDFAYCNDIYNYFDYYTAFTPLSAVENPDDPAAECQIEGLCCYGDNTYDLTLQADCEPYPSVVFDPVFDQSIEVTITADYIPRDDADIDPQDYSLSVDEIEAACDASGICCYTSDDPEQSTYDIDVTRSYCNYYYGDFKPFDSLLEDEAPSEACSINGVCCYDESEYYAGEAPDRRTQSSCEDLWGGKYHTFDEANIDNDYSLTYAEMRAVCRPRGLCCIDYEGDGSDDTYQAGMTDEECGEYQNSGNADVRWFENSTIPSQYTDDDSTYTLSDYCPVAGLCCPGANSSAEPTRTTNPFDCEGTYVSFDVANRTEDSELDSDEITEACREPGYCCNALDMIEDEVYGSVECETPERFVSTVSVELTYEEQEVTWDLACAAYCCSAPLDEDGNYISVEVSNLAADYGDSYFEIGGACEDLSLDLVGTVQEGPEDVCSLFCCLEVDGEVGAEPTRTAYLVGAEDANTLCEYLYDDIDQPLSGGDGWGWPTFDESAACPENSATVCCTIEGEEVTLEAGEIAAGEYCNEVLNEADCSDADERDPSLCFQEMEAVAANERESDSAGDEPEPLCQLYCCDSYGDPYTDPAIDEYSPCDVQLVTDEMGEELSGGENSYPTYDKDLACPERPVYCCEGGEGVVEATDKNGKLLRNDEGAVIKAGDSCADFGNFNDFPAQAEWNQDYACDFFCCDAETEEQVELTTEQYNAVMDEDPDAWCNDFSDEYVEYVERPVGPSTECKYPKIYCCEGNEGGPTGKALVAYQNDGSGNNRYDDSYCYGPNPTRAFSEDMACCQGNADTCEVSGSCITGEIFGFEFVSCNPDTCAAGGCTPNALDEGVIGLIAVLTDYPWDAGVSCDVCNAAANPDELIAYACDYYGGYYKTDPSEWIGGDPPFVNEEEAAIWCQLVAADKECTVIDTLAMANYFGVDYFGGGWCQL